MTPPLDTTPAPSATERLARVRAVLFDLDGTLIDTGALILASFRYATEAVLGEPLPDDVLMRNVGVPLKIQMTEFDPERADELLRVYREHNAAQHDALAREFPGTSDVLEELRRRGTPVGIVTSKSSQMAERGLRLFGLRDYFEVIVSADDVDIYKPDPHPIRVAAGRLGVDPAECVYVGDSPHDMDAALGAGSLAVAALWGIFTPEDVLKPGPEFAIEHISDLVPLLDGDAEPFLTSNHRGDTA